ncbi:hypothetical protein L6R53_05955 [Myxococcota bacterium]|nr:hypothetical protein [Myxococcota bacterium]
MKLSARITALELSAPLQRRFRQVLAELAASDGEVNAAEARLIDRLAPPPVDDTVEPAPLQGLWKHAEVLVEACLFVAVCDGEYCVEEARRVSELAHALGLSARRLREVEARTFAHLQARS